MSDKDSHIDRLYAHARQRLLRMIVDELRTRLRPFSRDMDPELFRVLVRQRGSLRSSLRPFFSGGVGMYPAVPGCRSSVAPSVARSAAVSTR